MVKYESDELSLTLSALADPTRRAILARLAQGEATVSELAEPFDMSLPAISKHLRVLERAGLLISHREGRTRRCRIDPDPLDGVTEWIRQQRIFWSRTLDVLATYLESQPEETQDE